MDEAGQLIEAELAIVAQVRRVFGDGSLTISSTDEQDVPSFFMIPGLKCDLVYPCNA